MSSPSFGTVNIETSNEEDPDQLISSIAAGFEHSILLTKSGRVVVFGDNAFCQLGTDKVLESKIPLHVTGLPSISTIFAGSNTSFALSSDGTCYAFGQGCPLAKDCLVDHPIIIPEFSNAKYICSNDVHSFALTHEYKLLCLSLHHNVLPPQDNVLAVTAYSDKTKTRKKTPLSYCMFLSTTGDIFYWETDLEVPKFVMNISDAIDLSLGWHCCAVLRSNGSVFQIEIFEGGVVESAKTISGSLCVTDVRVGQFHSLFLTEHKLVYGLGEGFLGQLGACDDIESKSPQICKGVEGIIQIATGSRFSLILDSYGVVYCSGSCSVLPLGTGGICPEFQHIPGRSFERIPHSGQGSSKCLCGCVLI
ncbi:hypothetical protein RCL1_000121 [Eukaryota sp. TZLM3-RCL]